jgi:hypothetical protein
MNNPSLVPNLPSSTMSGPATRMLIFRAALQQIIFTALTASSGAASLDSRPAPRLAPIFNVDAALTKSFKLPWEGKRLTLRAEAFNLFNHANFTNPRPSPSRSSAVTPNVAR